MDEGRRTTLDGLLSLIALLRGPGGCPWDRQQHAADIGRYLLEESYEVLDAIASGSPSALREELGDTLFQIVFLAHLAAEQGQFDMRAVIEEIAAKMVRRHPHVFSDRTVASVAEVKANWQEIKAAEQGHAARGLLDGIPRSLPALRRAQKMTARAATVGFDWSAGRDVLAKLAEELGELQAAVEENRREGVAEEMGDVLFSLVNLSRFLQVDAEEALRAATAKFATRFAHIERALQARGRTPAESTLAEMDALWDEAKRHERQGTDEHR